jgi:hypothetical protein
VVAADLASPWGKGPVAPAAAEDQWLPLFLGFLVLIRLGSAEGLPTEG